MRKGSAFSSGKGVQSKQKKGEAITAKKEKIQETGVSV